MTWHDVATSLPTQLYRQPKHKEPIIAAVLTLVLLQRLGPGVVRNRLRKQKRKTRNGRGGKRGGRAVSERKEAVTERRGAGRGAGGVEGENSIESSIEV